KKGHSYHHHIAYMFTEKYGYHHHIAYMLAWNFSSWIQSLALQHMQGKYATVIFLKTSRLKLFDKVKYVSFMHSTKRDTHETCFRTHI
ncbi:hypothetical protein ACJX0J_036317, partial [Zea mays]